MLSAKWQPFCLGLNMLKLQNLGMIPQDLNTMATDALAPWVAGSSETMVLTVLDKQILDFHKYFKYLSLNGLIT